MMMKKLKNKNNIRLPITDIHTHILHSIDDGSSSIDESLELLKREKSQGVTNVALTPHFDLERISLEDFLVKRAEKYKELKEAVKIQSDLQDLNLYLGAEVKYNPNLVKSDINKLVISGTNCLLLELPATEPFYLDETLQYFSENGVTPIFAHIERCASLCSSHKLEYYKNKGVKMQSNLSALLNHSTKGFILRMIKKGYIDILASDSHNICSRPPVWDEALKLLNEREEERIKRNALELFSDD